MATMKRAYYYVFLDSKAKEELAAALNIPLKVTRLLVEVRDYGCGEAAPAPYGYLETNNRWKIRKSVAASDVSNGKLTLSENEVFDHVFRYWPVATANSVLLGGKVFIDLYDITEESNPKKYQGGNMYVAKGFDQDTYVLGCMDLIRSRRLCPGDEIGLFCDPTSTTFRFKLLRRGVFF